jgi:pimeloyl-ACP methyl ester carboxylesterase
MQAWLVRMYYKYSIYSAGHTKHSLRIDNNGVAASFSYTEKGSRRRGKPTIVFVHGISSSKEGWMSILKNIPADYHCIAVDLPAHGETVGFNEDVYSINKFVEKLKLVQLTFDCFTKIFFLLLICHLFTSSLTKWN